MTTAELVKMINDPSVSDDAIFEVMKHVVADKFDAGNKYLPPTQSEQDDIEKLYDLLTQFRATVMDMHGAYIVNQLGGLAHLPTTLH